MHQSHGQKQNTKIVWIAALFFFLFFFFLVVQKLFFCVYCLTGPCRPYAFDFFKKKDIFIICRRSRGVLLKNTAINIYQKLAKQRAAGAQFEKKKKILLHTTVYQLSTPQFWWNGDARREIFLRNKRGTVAQTLLLALYVTW